MQEKEDYTWEEVQRMNKEDFNAFLEALRKKLNYHKYQMGELLQMGDNSYYVKVGPLERSEFTNGERMLIWYIYKNGVPAGFFPARKSTSKNFQPTF